MSQIRSRKEYLIPSGNIVVLVLHFKYDEKAILLTVRFSNNSAVAYFFGPPRKFNLIVFHLRTNDFATRLCLTYLECTLE